MRWLGTNRSSTRTLCSVVDIGALIPDWAIGDVQICRLSAEVILRVVMVIFKDQGPPMSFKVYKTILAD